MDREEEVKKGLRQPARSEPIEIPRPPLDWGDEEPDTYWEDLYYRGLVNPPYRSPKEQRTFWKSFFEDYKPIGKPMTNDELVCALGRCHCDRCE